MIRIVGTVADRLPEALRGNAVAEVQGFSGQLGQVLVVAEAEPVVYVGLGTGVRWCPEDGYRALQGLAGLQVSATDCDTSELVSALGTLTDADAARELVDIALALALSGTGPDSSVGATIATAISRAQRWTNADSRTLNPSAFVSEARESRRVIGPLLHRAGG